MFMPSKLFYYNKNKRIKGKTVNKINMNEIIYVDNDGGAHMHNRPSSAASHDAGPDIYYSYLFVYYLYMKQTYYICIILIYTCIL